MRRVLCMVVLTGCIAPTATLEQEIAGPELVVDGEQGEVVLPFDVAAQLTALEGERLPSVSLFWELDLHVINDGGSDATLRTVVWSDADAPVPTPWDWQVEDEVVVVRRGVRQLCTEELCTSGWTLGLESRGSEALRVKVGGRVWISASERRIDRLDASATRLDLWFGESR